MFIDLDNFKHYNDTYGHDVGDFVLIKMADIFTEVCGKDGFVCRYGGDEFLIFLYTDDRDIFKEKAERIYQIIDEADGFSAEISENSDSHSQSINSIRSPAPSVLQPETISVRK